MTFFEERVVLRIREKIVDEIDHYVRNWPGDYDNRSHFIRCAINELLQKSRSREAREVLENGKKDD